VHSPGGSEPGSEVFPEYGGVNSYAITGNVEIPNEEEEEVQSRPPISETRNVIPTIPEDITGTSHAVVAAAEGPSTSRAAAEGPSTSRATPVVPINELFKLYSEFMPKFYEIPENNPRETREKTNKLRKFLIDLKIPTSRDMRRVHREALENELITFFRPQIEQHQRTHP
jgi:hypothetical protein